MKKDYLFLIFSFALISPSFCSEENLSKPGHSTKENQNHDGSFSRSFYRSQAFTMSDINGKRDKHFKDLELEESLDNDGKKSVHRKFGQMASKDNDKPMDLVRRGNSNDEKEELILGKPERSKLSEKQERDLFGRDPIFNAFSRIGSKRNGRSNGLRFSEDSGFGMGHFARMFQDFGGLVGFDENFAPRHSMFDDFFQEKKSKLMNGLKKNLK